MNDIFELFNKETLVIVIILFINERNDYSAFSDNVIKELLVVPEGFPVERVHSHMACPKGNVTSLGDVTVPHSVLNMH